MARSSILPVIIKGEYAANGAFQQLVQDARQSGDQAKREFEANFDEIGRTARQALSIPRNQAGALNLGAEQYREAARDAEAYAIALREVTQAAVAEAAAVGDTSEGTRRFIQASRAATTQAEIESRELNQQATIHEKLQAQLDQTKSATERLVTAQRAGTTARGSVVNSARAERTAFVQLGQQMQDVTVQAQMGTNAFTIFAQQVPQAAFALSGLERSANKTKARIGALATFMSGPWGAAIFAATAILGPLIYRMIDTGDAADDAKDKVYDFADGLHVLELSAEETTNAMGQLVTEMRNAIAVQGDFLNQKALIAGSAVNDLESRIGSRSAEIAKLSKTEGGVPSIAELIGVDPTSNRLAELRAEQKADRKSLQLARQAQANSEIAVTQSRVNESLDAGAAATGKYNRAIGKLNENRRKSISDPIGAQTSGIFIGESEYEAEFRRLTKIRDAEQDAARKRSKKDSSSKADRTAERAARAAYQLSEFSADTSDRIERMRQSFEDTPPAIARANDAMARLADLSSDVDEKMRRGLDPKIAANLKAEIASLEPVIRASVNEPFDDMIEAAGERAAIDELLIQGREIEAEVLARTLDLIEAKGSASEAQVATIHDIVVQERLRSNELEKQNELRQREVRLIESTRDNIRETMSDLARGGGVGAIGRLFKRQFDLVIENQLDNLFEGIFGDFFRNEKDKALGFDKVKEASGRQVETINRTIRALEDFQYSVSQAATAANDNSLGVVGADGAVTVSAPFNLEAAFDKTFGAGSGASRTLTPNEFLGTLVGKVADVFVDKTTAKKIGEGISEGLSGGQGAGYGVLAGGLAFGESGSPLFSALGGKIGEKLLTEPLKKGLESVTTGLGKIAGPLAGIAGGLIGGLLGGALSSTKRASSTIGVGADGTLQVVSTRGNSSSRKKASTGAAGEALDTLDRIA